LRFDRVDTSSSKQQQSRTFRARKQIVVSGGTLSSPLILQRSGIGDANKLRKVGVKPIVDLPGVGLNFQDHYLTFSGEFEVLEVLVKFSNTYQYTAQSLVRTSANLIH
jgi:choline dehydrogenase-like flavoprotein